MANLLTIKKTFFLIAVGTLFLIILQNCTSVSTPKTETANDQPVEPNEVHLGELMGRMQYNFVKLGLALQHRNQPLATFYMQEVNESYDDISSKNITQDGRNISSLITAILAPEKNELAAVIANNDTVHFNSAYHAVVMSCNNCHIETNHDFIVIEEPHQQFNGQDFGAQHSEFSE